MRAVTLVALLALFVSAAFAFSSKNYYAKNFHDTTPLSEAELCDHVGRLSGCSGCEMGTKRLCTWTASEVSAGKKRELRFNDHEVVFQCVPTHDVPRLMREDATMFVASSLCPTDPKREPIVRAYFEKGLLNLSSGSLAHSRAFDSNLVDWPSTPYFVDRTSYYGEAGYGRITPGEVPKRFISCANVVEDNLVDVHDENGILPKLESNLLNGILLDERDKFCARVTLAQYISSRCPAYGVAVSGICKSFYEGIIRDCARTVPIANVGALNSPTAPISKAIEAYTVVPDNTPYCLNSFHLQPSGRFESLAGLHIPVETLQAMWNAGNPFQYDCDEAPCSRTFGSLPSDTH